jgi:hypothetical protein
LPFVGSTMRCADAPSKGFSRAMQGARRRLFLHHTRLSKRALVLFAASAVKLVAEIALLALLGRFLLGLLAGAKREGNFFYKILETMTQPFIRGTRLITPRAVLDRHLPLATFVLMLTVWLVATLVKVETCLRIGIEQCR